MDVLIEMTEKTELIAKQSNALVEASYKLNLHAQRLIMYTLAKARERHDPMDMTFHLHASEFAGVFGLSKKHAYRALKLAAESVMSSTIKLANVPLNALPFDLSKGYVTKKVESRSGMKLVTLELNWFSSCVYNDQDGSVSYRLTPELNEELSNMLGGFTLSDIQYLKHLDCPHVLRLYTWLCRVKHLNHFDSEGGKRFQVETKWIVQRLDLGDSYYQFKNLRRRILEPALKKINEHTDITVSIRPIYEGRIVTAVEFFYLNNSLMPRSHALPLRPRLPRRPHVTKGTHAEGVWARQCIEILKSYRESLKPFDKRLSLADLRKLLSYYKLIGDTLNADKIQVSIDKRQVKVA